MSGVIFSPLAARNMRASRVLFVVASDVLLCHHCGHWNWPAERVRMRGAEAGYWLAGLSPGRRVLGMGMRHPANLWKCFIKDDVRRQVGGGFQLPFDNLATEIRDDQVFQPHLLVRNSTRFNDDQPFFPGDPADVSEGVQHQPSSG